MFRSNLPALGIWVRCRKPVQIGMTGAIPVGVETTEIEAVCRACKTELTVTLLHRIRHLDTAYRDAVIEDLNNRNKRDNNK